MSTRSISTLARALVLTFSLTVAGLSGCGGDTEEFSASTYPVEGKVLLPDGSPLGEGTVRFVPKGEKGWPAAGNLKSDGTFALTTRSEGDGAAEGEYLVAIESPLATGAKGKKLVVPSKYNDENTSGLEVSVTSGPNNLEPFKLDTKAPKVDKGDDRRD